MVPKSLRTFLDDVIALKPGSLKRIDAEVDRRFGITAYGVRAEADPKCPALMFTNVKGSAIPCVSNLVATHERMALALNCDVEDLKRNSSALVARGPLDPVEVRREDAPVKSVVWRGDDVDLNRLPIPVHNELDGGPYLTAAVTVMRDPDSGRMNAGVYREHVYDSRHMGIWFFGSHHGGTIHRRYEADGKPTPVAIVIGHHPGFLMGAVSRLAGIGGEYEAAGAMLEEPLEVVRAENSDLLVPAQAEIILEGVVLAGEEHEEGPFAEWPGHYTAGGPKPVIRIDTVTMRADAIFHDIQAAGQEHRLMGALPRITSIYRNVSQVIPGLVSVNVPTYARMNCYLAIKKELDNDPLRAGFAALNTEPENLRMVVVVDDDIDVYDEREVAWAIGTRMDAERDLTVIPGWSGPGGLLPTNWSYDANGERESRRSSGVIMDATKPTPPLRFPPRARVPADAVAAADLTAGHDVTPTDELPWRQLARAASSG
jgi:2,5-furandicarboxylate decarboxylase 1